ncbi:uncharacterized protein VTP21DRAFT_11663 [Calcarisporiella thermophila]|uniref:uncharacterized protein n=1 Tax=Calcarisporiella thermophila TaxID=911321 RepID=UPI0037422CB7
MPPSRGFLSRCLYLLFAVISCIFLALAAPLPAPLEAEQDGGQVYISLPGILRNPAVALIGEHCYTTLVEQLHLLDSACLRHSLSKGLGMGIVVGSAIVKVPQLLTILRHASARGVSFASCVLETLAYGITLFYNVRMGYPFSTYGEVLFLTMQNAAIAMMILWFEELKPRRSNARMKLAATFVGMFVVAQILSWISSGVLTVLQATSIPITLASKVPQIWANWKNAGTGRLSALTVFAFFAGTSARVFTTLTELDDPLVLFGNASAAALNGVLVLQVIYYNWRWEDVSQLLTKRLDEKAD